MGPNGLLGLRLLPAPESLPRQHKSEHQSGQFDIRVGDILAVAALFLATQVQASSNTLSAGLIASLAGGFVGGVIGALTQVWVSRKSAQRARLELAHRAAADILHAVYNALEELTHVYSIGFSAVTSRSSSLGSSTVERLQYTQFVSGPALTEELLRERLWAFRQYCYYVWEVDPDDLPRLIEQEVIPYGQHLRDCFRVYLDGPHPWRVLRKKPIVWAASFFRPRKWSRRYLFPTEAPLESIRTRLSPP